MYYVYYYKQSGQLVVADSEIPNRVPVLYSPFQEEILKALPLLEKKFGIQPKPADMPETGHTEEIYEPEF